MDEVRKYEFGPIRCWLSFLIQGLKQEILLLSQGQGGKSVDYEKSRYLPLFFLRNFIGTRIGDFTVPPQVHSTLIKSVGIGIIVH